MFIKFCKWLLFCYFFVSEQNTIKWINYDKLFAELILFHRSVFQANLFLVVLQFSIPPWYYDDETVNHFKQLLVQRSIVMPHLIEACRKNCKNGEPIIWCILLKYFALFYQFFHDNNYDFLKPWFLFYLKFLHISFFELFFKIVYIFYFYY